MTGVPLTCPDCLNPLRDNASGQQLWCPNCRTYVPTSRLTQGEIMTELRNEIPGWEGTIGPGPSQYREPHVYARDVTSGAGNAAPRWRRQIGRYRWEFTGRWRGWGVNDGCKGVSFCRTPWGAWRALRRWQRVLDRPVEP